MNKQIKNIKDLKIALVKQNVYHDLYTTFNDYWINTIFSSNRRTGPIGLIEGGSDFFILNNTEGKILGIWKQKVFDCGHKDLSFFYREVKKLNGFGISYEAIDWSKYDIIISLDFSLPIEITKKLNQTLVACMPGEPCMSIYKLMRKNGVIKGYDLFLNQQVPNKFFTYRKFYLLGRSKLLPLPNFLKFLKKSEIDFPYTFGKFGCISDELNKGKIRKGFGLEFHTEEKWEVEIREKLIEIDQIKIEKKIENRLHQLSHLKYFIVYRKNKFRKLWGNSLLEAGLCGSLVLHERKSVNPGIGNLYQKNTTFKNLNELQNIIRNFETNPELYEKSVYLQKMTFNQYNYKIPLEKLLIHYRNKSKI